MTVHNSDDHEARSGSGSDSGSDSRDADSRGRDASSEGRSASETGAHERSSDTEGRDGSRARDHRRHRRRHGGRKERVLHTRISEQLSDDIRRLAEDLRVPTSNLVRNVLEEVFTMVESVSEDVGEIFEEIFDEAESVRDRIRRQSERSRHSRHRRRHRSTDRSRDRGESFDSTVEEELRRDEVSESARGPGPAQRPADPAPEPRERPEFPEVLGWQPLVLNREQICASCGVGLPRGTRAFVGLGEQGLLATTLCRACTGIR